MRNGRNGGITFNNNRKWITSELKRVRSKRMIKAYITMMLNGNIDYKQLGIIWKPTEKIPEASIKRILKQKETQNMIDEALQIALTDNKVTYDYLIKERKTVIEDSKTNKRPEVTLKAIEGFEDMYSMRNNQKQITTTETYDFKKVLKEGESVQTEQLKATQETTKQVDKDKEKVVK